MLPRLAKALTALTLACSIGMHWTLFQSVAWVGMVIQYSQDAPLTEALAKTFDGKHPCSLCKQIAKSKKSEQKSEFPSPINKFEFLQGAGGFCFSAPTYFWKVPAIDASLRSIHFPPPTPPPRGVIV